MRDSILDNALKDSPLRQLLRLDDVEKQQAVLNLDHHNHPVIARCNHKTAVDENMLAPIPALQLKGTIKEIIKQERLLLDEMLKTAMNCYKYHILPTEGLCEKVITALERVKGRIPYAIYSKGKVVMIPKKYKGLELFLEQFKKSHKVLYVLMKDRRKVFGVMPIYLEKKLSDGSWCELIGAAILDCHNIYKFEKVY